MATKIKFLKIGIPIPWKEFCKLIKGSGFNESKGSGFDLHKVTSGMVAGFYTERKEKKVWVSDINGESRCERLVTFERIGFSIERACGILRIDNPPRSLKGLSAAFFSMCGAGFYLGKVSIDPVVFSSSLRKKFPSLYVKKVELKNIVLNNSAIASMLASADKDVIGCVDNFMKGKSYSVFRAEVFFSYGENDYRVSLSSNADFCFAGEKNSEVVAITESVIFSLLH